MPSAPIHSRLILVPLQAGPSAPAPAAERRRGSASPLRRYRLARLELNRPRELGSVEHLLRLHD